MSTFQSRTYDKKLRFICIIRIIFNPNNSKNKCLPGWYWCEGMMTDKFLLCLFVSLQFLWCKAKKRWVISWYLKWRKTFFSTDNQIISNHINLMKHIVLRYYKRYTTYLFYTSIGRISAFRFFFRYFSRFIIWFIINWNPYNNTSILYWKQVSYTIKLTRE